MSNLRSAALAISCLFVSGSLYATSITRFATDETAPPLNAGTTQTLIIKPLDRRGRVITQVSGTLLAYSPSGESLFVDKTTTYQDGAAHLTVFPKRAGDHLLRLHDPESRQDYQVKIAVAVPAQSVSLRFSGFDYHPVFTAAAKFRPFITPAGDIPTTAAAYLKVSNPRTGIVYGKVADLRSFQSGSIFVDVLTPGKYTAELSVFPKSFDTLKPNIKTTTRSLQLNTVVIDALPESVTPLCRDFVELTILGTTPQEWRTVEWPFGIAVSNNNYTMDSVSTATLDRQLRWQYVLGATWGRNDITSAAIPLKNGEPDFARLEPSLQQFRNRYIKLALGVDTGSHEMWETLLPKLHRRQRTLLYALELQMPETKESTQEDYAGLIKSVWKALKGDSPGTTGTQIVVGGRTGLAPESVSPLIASLENHFNALSCHWFPPAETHTFSDSGFENFIVSVSQAFKNNAGEDKQLWLGKTGWSDRAGEETQAVNLVKTFTVAFYNGVSKVFWSDLTDRTELPWQKNHENTRGLLYSDYRPKLSAVSYSLVSNLLAGLTPLEYRDENGFEVYTFEIKPQSNKLKGVMHVAWSKSSGVKTLKVPVKMGGFFYAVDAFGKEPSAQSESSSGSPIRLLEVDHVPVFIWDSSPNPK